MKTSSCKAKARRAQQEVCELLLKHSKPQLESDDVRSTSMGSPGRDVLLSPAAQKQYPFACEVKNVEKLNIREAYIQAIGHAKPGDKPIVFHRRNNDMMLVTLDADDFLELAQRCPYDQCCGSGSSQAHDVRLSETVQTQEPGVPPRVRGVQGSDV